MKYDLCRSTTHGDTLKNTSCLMKFREEKRLRVGNKETSQVSGKSLNEHQYDLTMDSDFNVRNIVANIFVTVR